MVRFSHLPLPDDQQKRIQGFLSNPGYQDLLNVLMSQAAYFTAEAGNSLIEGEEYSENDAKNHAIEANRFRTTVEMLERIKSGAYKLRTTTLGHSPTTG